MRPLFHPSLEDVSVEDILHALSDPVRVAIFAEIVGPKYSRSCSNFSNISDIDIPKSTLSTLQGSQRSGIGRGERRGVEMHNAARCAEIEQRFAGLIRAVASAHNIQSRRKPRAGNASKRKPTVGTATR